MNKQIPKIPTTWVWRLGLLTVAVVGGATWNKWFPAATSWVDTTIVAFRADHSSTSGEAEHEDDSHSGHDHHAHAGHSEESSLELSSQALRNIGLTEDMIKPVKLETFNRSITVPALVVERPGRTRVQVATPMTGVITHVHAVEGEAVEPGTLLFQIRLTHEDLVNAQTEFVRTMGELEVEQREIARLKEVTQSGAVPGKLLLEREYARDRLTALMLAQREALKLHGLSEEQVNQIATDRRLLRELQVFAPSIDSHEADELKLTRRSAIPASFQNSSSQTAEVFEHGTPLMLQQLDVHKGQSVTAGETLCVLADYDELFIEGMAFEQDLQQLRKASEEALSVDAVFQQPSAQAVVVDGLRIAYFANDIDVASRSLHFYVHLPNEVISDRRAGDSRYVEWKYLPGQRLHLRVPVEQWQNQIVLPVDAVAREGAESFVFQQNGNHFDRIPVHVRYRDQFYAVIENDGSLFPGDVVAMRGAHQMQMALRNKSGGAVDPHAGHSH